MPDIIEVSRTSEEEILLIGCDGIWEKYGDDHEQLTKHFLSELKQFNSSDCLKQFFDKNLNPGTTPTDPYGRDNMTAILIEFKKWSLLLSIILHAEYPNLNYIINLEIRCGHLLLPLFLASLPLRKYYFPPPHKNSFASSHSPTHQQSRTLVPASASLLQNPSIDLWARLPYINPFPQSNLRNPRAVCSIGSASCGKEWGRENGKGQKLSLDLRN